MKSAKHLTGNVDRALLQARTVISILSLTGLIFLIFFLPSGPGSLFQNFRAVSAASDPVIAAAGDIACDPSSTSFNNGNGSSSSCRQKYTSDLLVNAGLAAVLNLGDNQYYCGGYQAYLQSYNLSWGRLKSITHPSVGNHEYLTSGGTDCNLNNAGAAGYYEYFGAAAGDPGKGYYSFDVGSWHLIALNSNCSDAGGCSSSSPQGKWLEADLNAHTNFCTLAYWHIPRFSSGGRAASNSQSFWQTLYNHNADLILAGHDHIYERFAPQTPGGVADPARGIRQLTVGSGGANHTSITTIAANSEVRNANTYGVIKLTLHATSYDWQFVPEAGKTFTDSGTGPCHGATADTTPPSTPTNLTASSVAWNQVSLGWTASSDNIAVTGYRIYRNGAQIANSTGTSYVDNAVQPQTSYSYAVKAYDGAGLTSGFSNTVNVTTPSAPAVLTFTPSDDTYVQSNLATSNFGASTQFVVDNSPIRNMLLKFSVTGVGTKQVLSAKLRLYCQDGSSVGGQFRRVADTSWKEGTVTWNTAPAADSTTTGTLGAVTANTWYEVDVTSLITGDGTFSLKGLSTSSDGAYYSTKEGAAGFAPQLVVSTSSTAAPTATRTSTAVLIPTATSTLQSPLLFSDGFESGDLSKWTIVQGLSVQNQEVARGSFAARGSSTAATNLGTYARKLLDTPQTDLYYRILFKVISQGANTVNLLKLRTAADTPVLSVSINNLGQLSYRNDVAGTSFNSGVAVTQGAWQSLQIHLRIADTASQIEIWYNEALVGPLSHTDAFGTNPIGRLQLGENTGFLSYDIAFDEVSAALSFVTGYIPPPFTPTSTATALPALTNTPTPLPPATATPTPLPPATATPTPLPPATATPTPLPLATATPTPLPAATATPTPLPPATSTPTPLPLATATPTPLPAATDTPTSLPPATSTPTPLPLATATPTPLPAATATPTPLPAATDTPTPLPPATSTPTPTDTPTPLPAATDTPTPLPPATATPTPLPPATSTPTPTDTPTPLPLATATPTPTDTPTPLPLATATPTPTDTPTPLPVATDTPTPLPPATSTPTPLPLATATPTPLPAATDTPTPLPPATSTPTPLPLATATPTPLPAATATPTPLPAATATPTPLPAATSTPTPTVQPAALLTFELSDDTYVQSDRATSNFGASTQFVADNSPIRNMLLKFTVTGVGTRTVVSAKLRLYCLDGSSVGGQFRRVADTSWTEGTVTWNTAPAADSTTTGTLGAVTANTWYEVDITSLITGDGTFSLKGLSTSSNGAYYSTKEGANPPRLVVETIP